jgi:serine/threonine protein kinase
MPAPATLDAFVALVDKSHLVDAERLQSFLQQAGAVATTPRNLAARLVAAGLLTQFQAEQLLLGKHRGFTLGKYRILERIGAGGHSTVYLGEHMLVKRRVAIKVLPAARSENPAALARFYREARAAGALDHPHLVKAHDVDCENGLHFLIMDYVDGSSLQQIVARFGSLAIDRAAHYIRQAAHALQAAHTAGLVHRDVKPANILLDRQGVIRVLDLGLARFFSDREDPLTLKYDNNTVLGTADYVAPEQALNSHDVDIRADIYSLGATFYFLLTARTLFPEGQITHKLIWHQTRQPTPLRQLRPETPAELAAVVERMIDKRPDRRYQTPAEVMEALTPWTRTPMPSPREDEMPRLSPALRAAAVADADSPSNLERASRSAESATRSVDAYEQPTYPATVPLPHRRRPLPEMATPPFSSSLLDTATDRPAPPAAPPTPSRSMKRFLSALLLVLLGVFLGAGIRLAAYRDIVDPQRENNKPLLPPPSPESATRDERD